MQEDNIPGHQILREDAGFFAVAHHAGLRRQDFLERLGGFFCPELLEETEPAVDDVYRPYRDAEFGHFGNKCADTRKPQHDCHHMREICQELQDERFAFHFLEDVWTVNAQAQGDFVLGQAFRSGV